MDYMDPNVCCPPKAITLTHSLTHSLAHSLKACQFLDPMELVHQLLASGVLTLMAQATGQWFD